MLGIVVYRNKKLQAHPMKLFMWIAFFDSYIFAGYLTNFFPYIFNSYKLFAATALFNTSLNAQYNAIKLLYELAIF